MNKETGGVTQRLVKNVRKGDTIIHEGTPRLVTGKAVRAGKGHPTYVEFETPDGVLLTSQDGYLEVQL